MKGWTGRWCCLRCAVWDSRVLIAFHQSRRNRVVKAGLEDSKALVGLRPLASVGDLLLGRKNHLTSCSSVLPLGIPTQLRHWGVGTQFRHHLVHQLVPIIPNGPGFHGFGLLGGTPRQEVLHQLNEGRTTTPLLEVFLLLLLQFPGVLSCL